MPSDQTSSAGASRARTSASPDEEPGSAESDPGSGESSQGSWDFCAPVSSSSKTSRPCACAVCVPCSGTLPRAGTMRNGIVSPRKPSAPLTGAIGSTWSRGEYPTPSATPYGTSQNEGKVAHKRPTAGTPSLDTWAKGCPTPSATDHKGSSQIGQRRGQLSENNAHAGTSLTDATCRSGRPLPGTCKHGGECKPTLSPRFVEWLMGFPIGWSACEPSETQLSLL
jgi:hypothetical protein